MCHEHLAAKVAYVCLYARTVEDASQNLVRLIVNRDCGFDEGATVWQDVLQDFLETSEELGELNRFGAEFTTEQWGLILEQTRAALLSSPEDTV